MARWSSAYLRSGPVRALLLPRPRRSVPLAVAAVSRFAIRASALGLDPADSAKTIEQRGGRASPAWKASATRLLS
jgi:hypothetical protein